MNDKIVGVLAIVLIIGGLTAASTLSTVPTEVIRLADIAIGGILGNMIGVHVRFKSQKPNGS
jgi:hypothetical protein